MSVADSIGRLSDLELRFVTSRSGVSSAARGPFDKCHERVQKELARLRDWDADIDDAPEFIAQQTARLIEKLEKVLPSAPAQDPLVLQLPSFMPMASSQAVHWDGARWILCGQAVREPARVKQLLGARAALTNDLNLWRSALLPEALAEPEWRGVQAELDGRS